MKRKLFSLLIALVALISLAPVTQAGFSMTPSKNDTRRQFNFEIKAGESKQDSVVIQNNNASPLTLLLYGADATHSNQGSFALVNRTATQRTVGQWVKFQDSTVTLKAGEKKEIPFTITLPDQVTPGNYAGGIAAETTTVQIQPGVAKTSTGAGVVISSRLVVKLFISVPGKKNVQYNWDDFSRSEPSNGKERFTLGFSNSGNAAIAIDSVIEISGPFNGPPEQIKIPETTLLQNEKISVPYDWDKKPFFGFFTAKATTTFWEYDVATNQNINPVVMTKTLTFWVIPWNIAVIILALIALVLIYVIAKIMMTKKLRKNSKFYEVQDGETLLTIAAKTGVNWKKLAKLNKIKPPYSLKKGDNIKVPFKK